VARERRRLDGIRRIGAALDCWCEDALERRSGQADQQLHRVVSVLKMRFSDHERAIFEYAIEGGLGIRVVGQALLGEGLLTGIARPPHVDPA
jgi:hypothetical protein